MRLRDLPHSRLVDVVHDEDDVAAVLRRIVNTPNDVFCSFEPITGAERSGRIFYIMTYSKSGAAFPNPMSAKGVARTLKAFTDEARYISVLRSSNSVVKGWEIRVCCIGGNMAVIAWAAWAPLRPPPKDSTENSPRFVREQIIDSAVIPGL